MKINVIDISSKASGTTNLSDAIFGLEPRKDILHRTVVYQLAKKRAGTHKVKNRAEITATTKKMYKQKGTGSARHGSKKVPQFRGGGRAFGPHPRDHSIKLTKKFRKLALRHALSSKLKDGNIVILSEAKLSKPKTSLLVKNLQKLAVDSALFIDAKEFDKNFELATMNIPNIDILPVQGINVYDMLKRDKLFITKAALKEIEGRLNE
ncbi:MAG: 50S ribosomal protein L4 [Pseudomonadota bacterium]|nr:50S ribosomal protein L4 [Rhodobiaceae bacterium]MBS70131.1 50S ribosomal protein L4 [Rhodobiaceae bacterium]MEC7090625.1 50S ribosomal protein L4 [Pseudomonadota bacterium]MED5287896.1 50S ribosomal protein L4 [Pseudomonadota bacterium]|tara:strand:- start:1429 stop:2052 length:624 start_codon:yes stop_codon:yes gene_type:complete